MIRNRIKNQRAMTLMELVISITILGVVMLGVMSFSLAIKRLQDISNKGSVVVTRLASVFADIDHNSIQAIGSSPFPGYLSGTEPSGEKWIAMRYDSNNNDEADATDSWVAYFIDGSNLYKCEPTIVPPLPVAGECDTHNSDLMVTNIDTSDPDYIFETSADNRTIDVNLLIRFNSSSHDAYENPEYRLLGTFSSPAVGELQL